MGVRAREPPTGMSHAWCRVKPRRGVRGGRRSGLGVPTVVCDHRSASPITRRFPVKQGVLSRSPLSDARWLPGTPTDHFSSFDGMPAEWCVAVGATDRRRDISGGATQPGRTTARQYPSARRRRQQLRSTLPGTGTRCPTRRWSRWRRRAGRPGWQQRSQWSARSPVFGSNVNRNHNRIKI